MSPEIAQFTSVLFGDVLYEYPLLPPSLGCLLRRKSRLFHADFYAKYVDVCFLLALFRLEEMVEFYKTKYRQDDGLMILRSLVYFDDVDLAEWPRLFRETALTFEQVKGRIIDAVKPLVQDAAPSEYRRLSGVRGGTAGPG